MAGIEIKNVYTGIAGSHILGFNSKGAVPIKNQEVKMGDIEKALGNRQGYSNSS